jgi:hypothetical protein
VNRKRTLNPRILAGRFSNARNRRAVARGRRPLMERAGSRIAAKMPLYRNRINRATGRPHRDDAAHGRLTDQSLARLRDAHAQRLMPHASPFAAADRVFGTGTADRVLAAMREANSNPWDVPEPRQPGRQR